MTLKVNSFILLSCFLSVVVISLEEELPNCRDLWPQRIPEIIANFKETLRSNQYNSSKLVIDDDLINEYIRIVGNVMNSNPSEQWKKSFINDFKTKCSSILENKDMKEAFYCYKEVIKGKCNLEIHQ